MPREHHNQVYRSNFPRLAYRHCLLGATHKELADLFDVHLSTIVKWLDAKPKFYKWVMKGKDIADAKVAERLYKRARGYSHKEEKIFQYQGEKVVVPTMKHYPPDTNAAIHWLSIRQRTKWRNQQDINLVVEETPRTTKEIEDGITTINEEIKRLKAQL